jgi:hypothetical protein
MMLDSHPGERFVSGVIVSFLLSTAITLGTVYLLGQFGRHQYLGPRVGVGMAAAVSAVLCLSGPVFERTVLRHRRRLFVLDADLNQSIYGRVLGVLAGVAAGAALVTQWF